MTAREDSVPKGTPQIEPGGHSFLFAEDQSPGLSPPHVSPTPPPVFGRHVKQLSLYLTTKKEFTAFDQYYVDSALFSRGAYRSIRR